MSVTTSPPAKSFTLAGYTLNNAKFTFSRVGNLVSLQLLGGTSLDIPGLDGVVRVGVTGTLNSDGTFRLTGTTSTEINLPALSIGTIPAGATVELTQNGLTITAGLNGSLMAELNFSLPSLPFRSPPSGSITNFSVSVTLDPLVFGEFRLESSSGGGFTATWTPRVYPFPAGRPSNTRARR